MPASARLEPEFLDHFVESEADVPSPDHLEFYRFWADYAARGILPGRKDLDPVQWRHILSHIMMVDVIRGAARLRFRFRLMGGHHVDVAGRNMTGEYLDRSLEMDSRVIVERYTDVVKLKRPHFWRNNFLNLKNRSLQYERCAYPFASDGTNVDLIVSVLVPYFTSIELGAGPSAKL